MFQDGNAVVQVVAPHYTVMSEFKWMHKKLYH